VAVIGRDNTTGLQVWSAEWGYPGDFDYREFHKKDGISGFQYWRVTGPKIDLAMKDAYHPDWAQFKVEQHADHFVHLLNQRLLEHHAQTGEFGLVSANFDTELFGHWWFEGVNWLEAVLRRIALSKDIQLTTALEYLNNHPPDTAIYLPEGSWGAGGTHFVWDNAETSWMWPIIYEAENRLAEAKEAYQDAKGRQRFSLDQAARELLLLQSSDWPFLVTTGQAREYAIQRFLQHVERFNNLLDALEAKEENEVADTYWELDKVFPEIDFKWFET
jgi:1,4-alpha-glucan branching enzyme